MRVGFFWKHTTWRDKVACCLLLCVAGVLHIILPGNGVRKVPKVPAPAPSGSAAK